MSYVANKNGNAPSLALKASDPKPSYADPVISPFRNADSMPVFIWVSSPNTEGRDGSQHESQQITTITT